MCSSVVIWVVYLPELTSWAGLPNPYLVEEAVKGATLQQQRETEKNTNMLKSKLDGQLARLAGQLLVPDSPAGQFSIQCTFVCVSEQRRAGEIWLGTCGSVSDGGK